MIRVYFTLKHSRVHWYHYIDVEAANNKDAITKARVKVELATGHHMFQPFCAPKRKPSEQIQRLIDKSKRLEI